MNVERYVPSVEDALRGYQLSAEAAGYCREYCQGNFEPSCYELAAEVETISVLLDMANALASEERIRASVAW